MNTAMILAAGRGERLKPLTLIKPKALCTVHKVPLIEYHVKRLAEAGFERLIINHAYLGGQIRQYLGNGARYGIEICYSPEPPGALETGGGIFNSLPLWKTSELMTVNADIYTDYPFELLKRPMTSLAHLVLVPKPPYYETGDFGLSSNRLSNSEKQYTFSGIACYHRDFFNHSKPGRYSLTPMLREATQHEKTSGEVYEGKWFDIGTMERLKEVNEKNSTL